jgi:hypothetical protein
MGRPAIIEEIEKYRGDPSSRQWDLPSWNHPLAQGVLPLFVTFEDHLFPVGTAFTVGRGVTFVVSAAHNIREAWKYERRLHHLLTATNLPRSISLKQAGISVLHQRPNGRGGVSFTIWPLETVEAAPPTDLVIGYPEFQAEFTAPANRLSFDLPPIGERVWSIGYCDFHYPKDGISLTAVREGDFDWNAEYGHKLRVVEGVVERIFVQKFAAGFVEGPCFAFSAAIAHAQSGGPVLSSDGAVIGVNAAGAESFFDRPMSIGSLLYPMLLSQLRFGVQMGPMRLNASHPLISLIAHGTILTDGSEKRVGLSPNDDGKLGVNPRVEIAMISNVHDDFAGFLDGKGPTVDKRPQAHFREITQEDSGPSQ